MQNKTPKEIGAHLAGCGGGRLAEIIIEWEKSSDENPLKSGMWICKGNRHRGKGENPTISYFLGEMAKGYREETR